MLMPQLRRPDFARLRASVPNPNFAILSGTFKNIGDEFYRRLAAPYEDRQMARSGDVDLYAEYLAEIEKPG